jgi:hypothetical protein
MRGNPDFLQKVELLAKARWRGPHLHGALTAEIGA